MPNARHESSERAAGAAQASAPVRDDCHCEGIVSKRLGSHYRAGRQTALTGTGITSSADAEGNRRSLRQHHKRSGLSNW